MGSAVVIDDFFDNFDLLRDKLDGESFEGVTNPEDGVFYPGVCVEFGDTERAEVVYKLSKVMGRNVKINYLFCRLSTTGMKAPHQAHNDAIMGDYTAIIYMNRPEHCIGGTELVRHIETGMDYDADTPERLEAWQLDHNAPEAWEVRESVEMTTNRLMLIDSHEMHRSQPINGFGEDAKDGRMVIICFFDLEQQ